MSLLDELADQIDAGESREETVMLDGQQAILSLPAKLSEAGVKDLKFWLNWVIERAERRAREAPH